jgi:hypothetical protein
MIHTMGRSEGVSWDETAELASSAEYVLVHGYTWNYVLPKSISTFD